MDEKYICKRCNYSTNRYHDLKRHLTKKVLCLKNTNFMKYSDDQLLVLSILPHTTEKEQQQLLENEIKYLKKSEILKNNKNELLEEISLIQINKSKTCKYCNESFVKLNDLKKHILLKCFYKYHNDIINNELNAQNNTNNNNVSNITLNVNSNNTNSNNTISNNINFYIGINSPTPFDEEWDISKISEQFISSIINSKYMYTELLKEILENEINLNVIIDKESKSGLVYKNNIDKYIRMKSSDIVNNTMEKLQNHLLEMNKNNKTQFEEVIDFSRKMITKKYNDYDNKRDLQDNVNDYISNIYHTKKDKATNIFNNLPINLRENDNSENTESLCNEGF